MSRRPAASRRNRARGPARLALAGLALVVVVGCAAEPRDDAELAPDFSLEAIDGATVSLAKLRGQVVVVDFWATWCAPCVFQIPVLNAFWERTRGDGVSVLGVSVDVGGREVVEPFAAEHEMAYPVLLGDEDLAQRYGAIGYPSLYVIAPDGRIASRHVGLVAEEELAAAVAEARAGSS